MPSPFEGMDDSSAERRERDRRAGRRTLQALLIGAGFIAAIVAGGSAGGAVGDLIDSDGAVPPAAAKRLLAARLASNIKVTRPAERLAYGALFGVLGGMAGLAFGLYTWVRYMLSDDPAGWVYFGALAGAVAGTLFGAVIDAPYSGVRPVVAWCAGVPAVGAALAALVYLVVASQPTRKAIVPPLPPAPRPRRDPEDY